VQAVWEERGLDALQELSTEKLTELVATVLPKELAIELDPRGQYIISDKPMTPEQWLETYGKPSIEARDELKRLTSGSQ
jgi:hypothetical protein